MEVEELDASTLLSPELLAASLSYGGSGVDCLLTSAKTTARQREKQQQKRSRSLSQSLPAEAIAEVQHLSKRQQKRVEQIQKRKERELSVGASLQTIGRCAVSATDRQLLTSSKDLNQALSVRQTLSLLLKKERAGLSLTEEEKGMLYVQKEQAGEEEVPKELWDAMCSVQEEESSAIKSGEEVQKSVLVTYKPIVGNEEDIKPKKSKKQKLEDDNKLVGKESVALTNTDTTCANVNTSEKESVLFSDLFAQAPIPVVSGDKDKDAKNKKTKKKKKSSSSSENKECSQNDLNDDATPESTPDNKNEEIKNVGTNLLNQLMLLKGKSKTSTPKVDKVDVEVAEDLVNLNVYKVEETIMPVNRLGEIQYSGELPPVLVNKKLVKIVKRPAKVVSDRINLPVCRMEQEIVEAIYENDVVVLCGETGSGKSTQVPQFLYESGYAEDGYIGVAQPRRVAVTSTADRVNYEMGEVDENGQTIHETKSINGHNVGRLVGYQIRYDSSTVGSRTKIKFMTDGILLREVTSDILLRSYRVIILDEAHERNVNTDILLGMLSRTIPLRRKIAQEEQKKWLKLLPEERSKFAAPLQPLKLIIMSATIRVQDFQTPVLFPSPPPVIHVEARQYPVVSHFAKRTEIKHYLKETHRKVCQIHRRLPAGGILVFLTGKREILYMCSKLQQSLRVRKSDKTDNDANPESDHIVDQMEDNDLDTGEEELEDGDDYKKYSSMGDKDQAEIESDADMDTEEEEENSDDEASFSDDEEFTKEATVDCNYAKLNETTINEQEEGPTVREQMLNEILGLHGDGVQATATESENVPIKIATPDETTNEPPSDKLVELPLLKPLIRPLYAMMPAHLQAKVFAPVPPGYRLIVVATNVAETSITIPNITYVVDCGRCKEKVMSSGANVGAGIAKYEINWISKASADQRQGRAGRTGPGHCYRLYSSNFYHEYMRAFLPPEITATPLEDVVLQMKALGIKEIESFPFPTLPPKTSLISALNLLTNLGAIVPPVIDTNSSSAFSKLEEKIIQFSSNTNGLQQFTDGGVLSDIGGLMAKFPLHPRFAKMLIVAARYTSLPKTQIRQFMGYMLTLVATMAERSVFMLDEAITQKVDERENDKEEPNSDNDQEEDNEETIPLQQQGQLRLFGHPNGDAMARLQATGAFIYQVIEESKKSHINSSEKLTFSRKELQTASTAQSVQSLCNSNFLHLPSLQRVLDLRMQLQTISESLFPALEQHHDYLSDDAARDLSPPSAPPSPTEDIALRQILLSGYCDSIARKAPLGMVKDGSRRQRLTAYFSCNPLVTEPLYIHPQSNLYHTDPTATLPEFVVYGSLLRNQRGNLLYMTNVSVISPSWISSVARDCPLLSWGEPLMSPAPTYDLTTDSIMCHVVPKFGSQQWSLPAVKRPMQECIEPNHVSNSNSLIPIGHRAQDEVYRWFARFLLEGSIGLRVSGALVRDRYTEPTSTITQNKVHPKISALLRQLVKYNIKSKSDLLKELKIRPTFLSDEIQAIMKVEYRKPFRMAWSML